MDQRVTFTPGNAPAWKAITDALSRHNLPVQMRMIDGQLAFPDEEPPETWKELRVATPAGMITLRREENAVVVVTWGNATPELQRDWNTLTAAIAEATPLAG